MTGLIHRPSKTLRAATLATGLVAALALPAAPALASSQFTGEAVTSITDPGWGVTVGGPNNSEATLSGHLGNSSLSFSSENFYNVSTNQPFKISTFKYTNGSANWPFVPTNYELPVSTELSFTDPAGLGNQTLGFDLDIELRTLTDGVEIDFSNASSTSFVSGGTEYQLDLLGFSIDGGNNFFSSFIVPKNKNSTFKKYLYAQITPTGSVVPLPAAAWGGLAMFGALGAVHRVRRRRLNLA